MEMPQSFGSYKDAIRGIEDRSLGSVYVLADAANINPPDNDNSRQIFLPDFRAVQEQLLDGYSRLLAYHGIREEGGVTRERVVELYRILSASSWERNHRGLSDYMTRSRQILCHNPELPEIPEFFFI